MQEVFMGRPGGGPIKALVCLPLARLSHMTTTDCEGGWEMDFYKQCQPWCFFLRYFTLTMENSGGLTSQQGRKSETASGDNPEKTNAQAKNTEGSIEKHQAKYK